MAQNGNFSLTITAVDGASKVFDSLNKKIAGLTAPAEKFNKSLAKFGEVSGLNSAAEGVQSIGRSAADAFRSLDRMGGPMASITSAASLAGMVELTRRWAEFGTHLGQAAYRMNMPVEALGKWQRASQLAGVDVNVLSGSMEGLLKMLHDAAWGDGAAASAMAGLKINPGTPGHIKSAADALGDVAEQLAKIKDPETQKQYLIKGGMDPNLLPMLKDGRAGLERWLAEAAKIGGMTDQMIANATAMNTAYARLGLNIKDVTYHIADDWSGTVTKVLNDASSWIEHNQKLAVSIGEIGAAVGVLAAIQPAKWVLRLLGLGGVAGALPPIAVLTGVGLAAEQLPPKPNDFLSRQAADMPFGTKRPMMSSDDENPPSWLERLMGGVGRVFRSGAGNAATTQGFEAGAGLGGGGGGGGASLSRDEFTRKFMPEAIAAGQKTGLDPRMILAQAALESDWGKRAPGGNMFGIKGPGQSLMTNEYRNGQMVREMASFRTFASPEASFDGYADFINNNPRYAAMRAAKGLDAQAAELGKSGYATAPNYGPYVAGIARQFPVPPIPPPVTSADPIPGHVQVDVNIKHDRVVSNTTTRGPVSAAPASVQESFGTG